MKTLALFWLGLVLPLSSHALNIGTNCEELRSSVYETRYFAQGNIKVQKADTEEPAAAAFHYLITNEITGTCRTFNAYSDSSMGFYSLGELSEIIAVPMYQGQFGLMTSYREYKNGEGGPLIHVNIMINLVTGNAWFN